MIRINNFHKIWGKDVGPFRIGRVEEINTAYLFTLYKFNRRNQIQINLERNPIGEQYELWCWSNDTPTAVPVRRMLPITSIKDMRLLIGYMTNIVMQIRK